MLHVMTTNATSGGELTSPRRCYGCAYDLALGNETQTYITYVMRRVELLKNAGIHPILVFDGKKVPLKANTHDKRQSLKDSNRDLAMKSLHDAQHLHGDERKEKMMKAHNMFQRSIKVTSEIIYAVHAALRKANVEFVVAYVPVLHHACLWIDFLALSSPFEADAQLVYLCKVHKASAIITEDSDILVYCITANVAVPILLKLESPSGMCKSAQKHVFAFRGAPGHLRLHRIVAKLKLDHSRLAIPSDYVDRCRAAEALFYHHYVYNADARTCEYLVNDTDVAMTHDIYDLVTCRGSSIVGVPVADADALSDMYHAVHHIPISSSLPQAATAPPAFIRPPPSVSSAAAPVVVDASDDEYHVDITSPPTKQTAPAAGTSWPRRNVAKPTMGILGLVDQYRRPGSTTTSSASRGVGMKRPLPDTSVVNDTSKKSRTPPTEPPLSSARQLFESLQAMPQASSKPPTPNSSPPPAAAVSFPRRTSGGIVTPAKCRSSAAVSQSTAPSATAKKPINRPTATPTTLLAFFSKKALPI
ncbi:hypothetical protein DYB30_006989 [Aphanomyces astaci]|uniref:Exonuclease 1 n=1 Tax=Aphanomyces astaci TaxID=112090 RepID=A0A397DY75_APHAT|nr:hypothetical protein DYB30_006989 [Aphanomyces astaci]